MRVCSIDLAFAVAGFVAAAEKHAIEAERTCAGEEYSEGEHKETQLQGGGAEGVAVRGRRRTAGVAASDDALSDRPPQRVAQAEDAIRLPGGP